MSVTACPHCQAQLDLNDKLPALHECSRDGSAELRFENEDIPECPDCGRNMRRTARSACPECAEPLEPSEVIERGTFQASDGTWHRDARAVERWEAAAPQRAVEAAARRAAEDVEREERNAAFLVERDAAVATFAAAEPGPAMVAALLPTYVWVGLRFTATDGGVLADVEATEADWPGLGKRRPAVPGSERRLTATEAHALAAALAAAIAAENPPTGIWETAMPRLLEQLKNITEEKP